MKNPLISIIVPAYNYGRFLNPCIDSVLEQTYPHWELLVIDNGSTDNTAEVLSRYHDPRIRKFKIEINDGPVKAWAMGYDLSLGNYIGLLPADDMFTPQKLEKQVAFLNQYPKINCVGTYIDVVDDAGVSRPDDHWMAERINREVDYDDLSQWRWKHHFCIPTAIYEKALCDLSGKIPLDGLTNICDWDFHVRLLRVGAQFAVIPERLTKYRWHQSNTSHQRKTAHNQWIYSHTRSLLPALKERSENYYGEVQACIEGLYLDPKPNFFLEDVPELWRCAHLETLLDPEQSIAKFPDYHSFRKYTEEWRIDSESRAAIAAIDHSLMTLRQKLLRKHIPIPESTFPLERSKTAITAKKVFREIGRGMKKLKRKLGMDVIKRQAA